VVGIDDPDLAADGGAAAGALPVFLRCRFAGVLVPWQMRRQRRQFGHAVELMKRGAGQSGHRAVEQRLVDRGGAVHDPLQR
jgi:hypothetical protein